MRKIGAALKAGAQAFIPEDIRSGEQPELLAHAYVIVGMLAGALGLAILAWAVVFVTLRHNLYFADTPYGFVVAGLCVLFYYLSLRLFRRTGSFALAGWCYALPTMVGIMQWIFSTGGFSSPAIALLLTIPVMVFMMSGRVSGAICLVLILLTISTLYYLEVNGFPFRTPPGTEHDQRVRWLLSWSLLGIVNGGSLWVYELLNRSLSNRLEHERNQFAFRAAHDPLTRIANRGTFESAMLEAIANCGQSEELRTVIVFIDLDDFKLINDRYGHRTGDEVLRAVAQRIRNSVRASDLPARLGGDEFAVMLNNVDSSVDIHRILENLVAQVASPISTREGMVEVTCSAGAVICPDHGTDPELLANYADKLMYRAKERKNSYLLAG